MSRMSFMCASTTVLGERREKKKKEREEIIARTHAGWWRGGWPLIFLSLSLRHLCLRVIIFFLRPAMETRIHTQGRNEDDEGRKKKRRERKRNKECGDLFHPSAAFGTS